MRRCNGEGILVAYGRGNAVIERCIVEENNHGINVHHISGEFSVRDNICKRNGVHKPHYSGIGIFVEAVHHISIIANVCIDNAWADIVWRGADEAKGIQYPSGDCVTANNLCLRNGSQGGIFINGTYSQTERFFGFGQFVQGERKGQDLGFPCKGQHHCQQFVCQQ
ncbi:MAG: hypothetical protein NZ805_04755 [Armatimonadetes bacterium]|nr:hypothetical protein [Armatimonadota bacterium]MDW8027250.1 hypothetical protein [Armatimonadota bacterium]